MCSNSVFCLSKLPWPSVAKITPVLVLWDVDEKLENAVFSLAHKTAFICSAVK